MFEKKYIHVYKISQEGSPKAASLQLQQVEEITTNISLEVY